MSDLSPVDAGPAWTPTNPFNVTKATDLTDEEIQSMWVDLGAEGGYRKIIDPRMSMPRVLLGGKGTGRTHLMRYLSAPLQRLRSQGEPFTAPMEEEYLGIYLRCTGLNAGRFQGKGIEDEAWEAVFTYSMDLWLARLALTTACETFGAHPELQASEKKIAGELVGAFDEFPATAPTDLAGAIDALGELQAELDLAVNNAALSRNLDAVSIRIARGRLPFVVPQIIARHVPAMASLSWLYLVDELENLTERQQRYVQTLIREREAPTSFILGTRTYGFRTRKTLSADEENKEGSEYAAVELDQLYLESPTKFADFCREIIAKRLADAGFSHIVGDSLDRYFYEPEQSRTRDAEVSFVGERDEGERRYLTTLRSHLEDRPKFSADSTDAVIESVRYDEHPVVERLNVMLLYKAWNSKKGIEKRAVELHAESRAFVAQEAARSYQDAMNHYGNDVVAKLLQEYGRKQRYVGIETFIRMAGGLPRNLLIILKSVVRAAEFNGETPFREVPVGEASQRAGVTRAAEWFYRDAKAMGEAGLVAEVAVDRVSTLMRALRFADRPPEAGICAFSINQQALDEAGRTALYTARDWSLLLEIPEGQRDKNTRAVKLKFQLNPMLSPRWDLPVTRRGTLDLKAEEVRAIFSTADEGEFDDLRRTRVGRSMIPAPVVVDSTEQGSLLDDGS